MAHFQGCHFWIGCYSKQFVFLESSMKNLGKCDIVLYYSECPESWFLFLFYHSKRKSENDNLPFFLSLIYSLHPPFATKIYTSGCFSWSLLSRHEIADIQQLRNGVELIFQSVKFICLIFKDFRHAEAISLLLPACLNVHEWANVWLYFVSADRLQLFIANLLDNNGYSQT